MGDTEKQTATLKRSKFQELKGEFKKIIWPTKEKLAKQSVVVTIVTVVLGVIIAVIDMVNQYGINFIVK